MSIDDCVMILHSDWTSEEVQREVAQIYRELAGYRPPGAQPEAN